MQSFKSHHYPPSDKTRFSITQEYAMYYYGLLLLAVIILVMIRAMSSQDVAMSLAIWGALGTFASLFLGKQMATVKLKKTYAEIFFVGEHFSLLSVHDVLYQSENKHAFPLRYANVSRSGDFLYFHFNDQIITLKKEDWADFELIWQSFHILPNP
ncbi:MAG: hypothetical protein ACKVTZ_14335 [Bacteroidia bacterium]